MALNIILNGDPRSFDALDESATLNQVVAALGVKGDRVAIEHNGSIAPRSSWEGIQIKAGDRLEVVHFVGGGTPPHCPAIN